MCVCASTCTAPVARTTNVCSETYQSSVYASVFVCVCVPVCWHSSLESLCRHKHPVLTRSLAAAVYSSAAVV